ncbi:hypothetical protein ACIGNX_33040 [Actinosynnema sp. NPDC053489]|uniref:hypothetical protein n=1 Tax=Actinosynnema sp. NPDC053489 TaxID=3363916 RepID=UPI0037CB06A0
MSSGLSGRRVRAALSALLGAVAVTVASAAVAAPAQAAPAAADTSAHGTVVRLRVEGRSGTIFEAPVFTTPHDVTTPSGGTHHCDGTNNGTNPTPGPTATGALDDGARLGGFTFDGTYWASFDDFFITRVAGDEQTATEFWGILLNKEFTPVGGCQQQVAFGDEVLFAFDAFSKSHVLSLSGPAVARVGKPATYKVVDASSGAPIAGATVNGATTDANGEVTLTHTAVGAVRVKADRADSIRSNSVLTFVAP